MRKVRAQVVTIQVGADDIEFSGCILHELGISLSYKIFGQSTSNCIKGTGLTDRIARRITRFRVGLNTILNTVRRKQPKATILLLNYYQPLPSPSQYVTLDKSFICERLKDPKRLQNAHKFFGDHPPAAEDQCDHGDRGEHDDTGPRDGRNRGGGQEDCAREPEARLSRW